MIGLSLIGSSVILSVDISTYLMMMDDPMRCVVLSEVSSWLVIIRKDRTIDVELSYLIRLSVVSIYVILSIDRSFYIISTDMRLLIIPNLLGNYAPSFALVAPSYECTREGSDVQMKCHSLRQEPGFTTPSVGKLDGSRGSKICHSIGRKTDALIGNSIVSALIGLSLFLSREFLSFILSSFLLGEIAIDLTIYQLKEW